MFRGIGNQHFLWKENVCPFIESQSKTDKYVYKNTHTQLDETSHDNYEGKIQEVQTYNLVNFFSSSFKSNWIMECRTIIFIFKTSTRNNKKFEIHFLSNI